MARRSALNWSHMLQSSGSLCQLVHLPSVQMALKRSQMTREELGLIYSWLNKAFQACGWPVTPKDIMYRTSLKQVAYEACQVCFIMIFLIAGKVVSSGMLLITSKDASACNAVLCRHQRCALPLPSSHICHNVPDGCVFSRTGD